MEKKLKLKRLTFKGLMELIPNDEDSAEVYNFLGGGLDRVFIKRLNYAQSRFYINYCPAFEESDTAGIMNDNPQISQALDEVLTEYIDYEELKEWVKSGRLVFYKLEA